MRLIDADLLKQNMKKYVCDLLMSETELYDMPLTEIDDAPTITPSELQTIMKDYLVYKNESERPRGEWVNTLVGSPSEPVTKCSLCGYDITFAIADLVKSESGIYCIKDYKPNFCPNCGAKMNN